MFCKNASHGIELATVLTHHPDLSTGSYKSYVRIYNNLANTEYSSGSWDDIIHKVLEAF
jgi:hypothetical protein